MGEVFLAYDDRLARPVAIKRVRLDRATPERRERLRREARAAAKLSHPAIVQVYDIILGDDSDCIVLEYVEGHSLARLVAEGRLAGSAGLGLLGQVAEGLAAAHARGVVHRDLKSENVLVTSEGRAKILDFGLAKPLDPGEEGNSLTRDGEIVGTLRAMSPEQARGEDVDARSDLFSLGVLVHEVFTGRSPFAAPTPVESLRKVIEEHPSSLRALRPELPGELAELTKSLLEKDPSRRPQSAAEVASRLAAISRLPGIELLGPPSTAEARPPGLSEQLTGGGRSRTTAGAAGTAGPDRALGARRRRRLVGAAAAVALLAAAGYLTLVRRPAPVRVVVLPVSAPSGAEDLGLVALGVEEAILSTLAAVEGVEAVAGREEAGDATLPVAAALATAADEVVRTDFDCEAGECRVSLRRLRGADGGVIRVAEPFYVPTSAEDFRDLAAALRGHLLAIFQEHGSRSAPRAAVRDQDYAAYLALKRRREAADRPPAATDLQQLEGLLETSPGLVGAYLLAANVARNLGDLERAELLLRRAAEVDPGDPRILVAQCRVQVAADRLDRAEATLAAVERMIPGQTPALRLRAELLAAKGELEAATREAAKLVRRRSSWQNLRALANFEVRLGRIEQARLHLSEALVRSPGNVFVLAEQGALEARYGDLGAAEETYRRLIDRRPFGLYYRNLGWVRYLRADYPGAAESYRAALALDPDHLLTRFNLATARQAAGESESARNTYLKLREDLEARGDPTALGPQMSLILAQCRARLGDLQGAFELAQRTVSAELEDPQDQFLAAQVFTLVGERLTALHYVERSLRGGIRPRWFGIPEFDPLRTDPRFQALLAGP